MVSFSHSAGRRGNRNLKPSNSLYNVNLCFSDLSIFGFAIINAMPRNFESLPELIKNIGIEKATHYGKSFKVITKSDPSNAAYTSLALGLHLDMPIYHYKPGVISFI